MARSKNIEITKREQTFADKVPSGIVREVPDNDNPYVAERVLWYGYDVLELMRHRSLVDVIFLLLKGELPNTLQARQLERILIVLANPGPRHASTRAVMSASVSKTRPMQFLPIGMALLGGEFLGAAEVTKSIKFFRKNLRKNPRELAVGLQLKVEGERQTEGRDIRHAPGFGSYYAGVDKFALSVARQLSADFPDNQAIAWGMEFSDALEQASSGWLLTGVAAAMFVELGFTPNTGAGLFQLAACPGLFAHGIEVSGKPLTAMPFVSDDDYHYVERDSDDP